MDLSLLWFKHLLLFSVLNRAKVEDNMFVNSKIIVLYKPCINLYLCFSFNKSYQVKIKLMTTAIEV